MPLLKAQQGEQWEGFRPMAYFLGPKAGELPLTRVVRSPEGEKQEPTTVLAMYDALVDGHATVIGSCIHARGLHACGMTFKTDAGETYLVGPDFNLNLLYQMLSLQNDGFDFTTAGWYWYDKDSKVGVDSYRFFVVCDERIVREEVEFYDSSGSGFNPSVFEANRYIGDLNIEWLNDPEWADARQRFWRRNFYKETQAGQIMALRNDRPDLWVYRDVPWPSAEKTLGLLSNVRYLLWVVIALLVLTLIRLCW